MERGQKLELGFENMKDIEAGIGIDVSEFEGRRAKLVSISKEWQETPYDEEGNFVEGLKRMKQVIRLETEKVGEFIDKKGVAHNIIGSELFNLKYNEETKEWGPSTSEKASLNQLLTKCKLPVALAGLKQLAEVIAAGKGPHVILKANKRGFLNFVY